MRRREGQVGGVPPSLQLVTCPVGVGDLAPAHFVPVTFIAPLIYCVHYLFLRLFVNTDVAQSELACATSIIVDHSDRRTCADTLGR